MRKKHSIHIICFIMTFLLLSVNMQVFASTSINVTSVSLNKTSDVLVVGKTDTLIATVTPTDATDQGVVWTTSNADVAKVFNGVVMAVSAGTAVITATTDDGYKRASCIVTVNNPIKTVSLDKNSEVLTVGESDTLVATINETSVNETTVVSDEFPTWTSSNPDVVQVGGNGFIYAAKSGTAVITVTTSGGSNTASCYVTVNDKSPLMSIILNKKADFLQVGATDTLTANVISTTTTNLAVNWTSSDPSIVKVVEGVLIAASAGTAIITATTVEGGQSATCTVTVSNSQTIGTSVQSISLNKTSDVLTVGGTDILSVTAIPETTVSPTVIWASSNPNVATVANGVVTAVSEGNAIITATTADGSMNSGCGITVTNTSTTTTPIQSITLNKISDILTVGGTDNLSVTIIPTTASNQAVTWVSSNPNVVTVSNGSVTAVSAGNAVITATNADGSIGATCNVTVNSSATSSINTTRLGGQDRYETSVAISQTGWKDTSSYAVLSSGNDFPDGLSSAALAKKYNAPILLTDKDSIPESVLNEIKRLQVSHIFIIGGTGVVSKTVENKLNAMGITTERFGGQDRYETSIKIAEKLGAASGEIIVANGYEWTDALSASAIGAEKGIPIILTDKDVLPDSIKSFISKNNFSKTYILGDTDLISATVANKFPNSQRIVGSTEYERNINIIKTFENDIDFSNICIASGRDFPDSISGSAFAAMHSSAIVLVDDSDVQSVTTQYINEKLTQVKNVYIFGLQGAVKDDAIQKLFNK